MNLNHKLEAYITISEQILISVCLKSAVIRIASILFALKNRGLTHKLEAYITVYGQILIILLSERLTSHV